MQNLNSIERFLFNGNVYLIQKKLKENKLNNPPNQFNLNNKNPYSESNSESNNEKNIELIPLKLLGSLLNLYFYSKNPKKSYEQLKQYYIKNNNNNIQKKISKNFSRLSSIRSQNSVFASESNFFIDEENSLDSNVDIKHFIPKNLEDFILIKLSQNEIYMINYDLNEALIEYKHKETNQNFKFKFKHNGTKEKNYIKIMIIIEAYKYSIKNSLLINPVAENKKRILANMSLRNKTLLTKRKNSSKAADNNVKAMTLDIMNTEFIINFLDNLIMNKFKILIIDEEFFQEEQNLLKIFTEFLVEFKEIKFKINLYEEDDSNINEENLVGGETINKETFASAFSDRFNLDSHESKPQNNSVITNNNNKIDNMNNNLGNDLTNPNFQLLIIDASNTFMNNRGFIKAVLPLAQKSPFLEKLILNNNYLTDDIFIKLNELNSNYHVKTIDLSYNKIKGKNLTSNLRILITTFFE